MPSLSLSAHLLLGAGALTALALLPGLGPEARGSATPESERLVPAHHYLRGLSTVPGWRVLLVTEAEADRRTLTLRPVVQDGPLPELHGLDGHSYLIALNEAHWAALDEVRAGAWEEVVDRGAPPGPMERALARADVPRTEALPHRVPVPTEGEIAAVAFDWTLNGVDGATLRLAGMRDPIDAQGNPIRPSAARWLAYIAAGLGLGSAIFLLILWRRRA